MVRFLARVFAVVALMCGPVFLGGVAWGFYLISEQSLLAFALICFATIIVTLGIAMILDKHSPLPPRQSSDQ